MQAVIRVDEASCCCAPPINAMLVGKDLLDRGIIERPIGAVLRTHLIDMENNVVFFREGLNDRLDEVLAVTRVFRYLLLGLIPAVLAMASLAQLPHI